MYYMKKKDEHFKARNPVLIFFAISVVGLFIVNLFPVSKTYSDILINGKKPSRLEYKFNILCDVFINETNTATVEIKDIEAYESSYTYRNSRQHRKTGRSYYVAFSVNFKEYFSPEEYKTASCIADLIECSDSLEVEYYPNCGIIKSVNGIEKNDYDLLASSVDEIESQKEETQNDSDMKGLIAAHLMSDCVGKTLTEIQAQFEEYEVEFDYDVIYLSSQLYEIDTIAFYENEEVYVVYDNSKEDLVAFPQLEIGMTKDEIIEVLVNAGFSYECDEFNCDNCGKNKLHTVGVAPGTMLPKGYKVWFSVDK